MSWFRKSVELDAAEAKFIEAVSRSLDENARTYISQTLAELKNVRRSEAGSVFKFNSGSPISPAEFADILFEQIAGAKFTAAGYLGLVEMDFHSGELHSIDFGPLGRSGFDRGEITETRRYTRSTRLESAVSRDYLRSVGFDIPPGATLDRNSVV